MGTRFTITSEVSTPAASRALFSSDVCGSGNGAVAAFRLAAGQVAAGEGYVASQGRQVGRDGFVSVRFEGADIHIGGACVTCIEGAVRL